MLDYSAARVRYESQRKPISYFGVPWDAWAEKANQPVADPADDGFFVSDSSNDLFQQFRPGVAGYPMRTVRRVAISEIIGYGHGCCTGAGESACVRKSQHNDSEWNRSRRRRWRGGRDRNGRRYLCTAGAYRADQR